MNKYEKVDGKVIKKKRKWRFTEIIILLVLIYTVMVFNLALYFAFSRESDSVWWYILPSIGALSSSAFAVFVWKEKNENLPKILQNTNYDTEQLQNEIQYGLQQEFIDLEKPKYY